jgi:hypothetical protein
VGWRAEHVHVFDAASGRRRHDGRTLAVDKINFAQSFA